MSSEVQIRKVGAVAEIIAAQHLFDKQADENASREFLEQPGHHLLVAYVGNESAGFVSGVEMIHPDKGREMFLYELAVAPDFQRRGIGTSLVRALTDLSQQCDCYGMWVLIDDGNKAGVRTYTSAGGTVEENNRLISWTFN